MPTPRICYLEIPAVDPRVSADFYAGVFGWRIRWQPPRRLPGARLRDATGRRGPAPQDGVSAARSLR